MTNPESVSYTDFQKVQLANQALSEENRGQKLLLDQLKNKMDMQRPENATLFGKMAEVMKAVKRVPKNGWNNFHNYAYPTETDLLEAVRDILAEAGLALMVNVVETDRVLLPIHDKYKPTDPEKTKMKWFTKIKMEFTLGCTDTGAERKAYFFGEGQDDDDKGLYKAYTNTMKYFLRQTFLIPTGDTQPDDDGKPMDVEYDKTPPDANNAPIQGSKQQRKPNTPADGKNGSQGKSDANPITYEMLLAKWKQMGGNDKNFKDFYDKQIKDGKTHGVINHWLDGKLAEKKKAEAEQKQQDQPNDADKK